MQDADHLPQLLATALPAGIAMENQDHVGRSAPGDRGRKCANRDGVVYPLDSGPKWALQIGDYEPEQKEGEDDGRIEVVRPSLLLEHSRKEAGQARDRYDRRKLGRAALSAVSLA